MRPPLWLDVKDMGSGEISVSLATCRNCGKPKLTSRPCGFDHLAALMEYNARVVD